MHFEGKLAIITGGTGSLGSVIVQQFLDSRATVVVPRRKNPSEAPSGNAHFIEADLTIEAEVDAFVREVEERYAPVDILVNAAGGYGGGKTIDEVSLAEWERLMDMNLTTTFLACRAALKIMLQRGKGRIVNVAAMPALMPGKEKGPYSVSKRGVVTLTEVIAEEVKGKGITANAIAPSIILTDENRRSMPNADTSKWVTPQEIAQLVMFLCSDDARSINGNVIKIFGGI